MTSAFAGFIHIGPRTSLYTPTAPVPGQLVIFCTWLRAARKHIDKYVALYKAVAPGARILIIESDITSITSRYERQRSVLQPAISVILDTLAEVAPSPNSDEVAAPAVIGPMASESEKESFEESITSSGSIDPGSNRPKILLHMFSNGGTNTATQLLIGLRARLQSPLPLCGMLFDSCPSKGTYWKSYDAMVLSFPKGVQRVLGAIVAHCILLLLFSWIALGNDNPATLQRRTLLDGSATVGSWNTASAIPKDGWEDGEMQGGAAGSACYFYSKADRMCDWTDVVDHAEEARRRGWRVRKHCFDASEHCAHFSRYSVAYTAAVKEMWDGVGEAE